MSDFPGIAEDIYKYQNMFDYSVWTPNTSIMCCNVPWDSSYRDIVRFDSESARDDYFASLADQSFHLDLSHLVYLRYGEPVRINVPFSAVAHCNYLVVHNPLQPVPGPTSRVPDTFYYFINDVAYIAPNTTQLNIQLDVWQSYYQYIHFGMAYIVKGHAGIANENVSEHASLQMYLTEPEGLDIGSEYDVVTQSFHNLAEYTGNATANQPWVIFTCSANLSDVDGWGDKSNPEIKTSSAQSVLGGLSGIGCYAARVRDFKNVIRGLIDYPWITQCINYITIVPAIMVEVEDDPAFTINGGDVYYPKAFNTNFDEVTFYNADAQFNWDTVLNGRYAHLKKFQTYPYSAWELTSQAGGEIVLKPEFVGVTLSDEIKFIVQSSICPPDVRMMVFPRSYNDMNIVINNASWDGAGNHIETPMFAGDAMDMAMTVTDFPQISIANDSYALYMASTQHQRSYQYQTAGWAQQKAQASARLAYNQASKAINTQDANMYTQNALTNNLAAISQQTTMGHAGLNMAGQFTNGIASAGSAAVGGGAAAGALSLAQTGVNTAFTGMGALVDVNATGMRANEQIAANTIMTNNNLGMQRYNRDTNYDYAMYAANGDYENAIAGILAKVQDAAITQPTTSGQVGGKVFNWANGYTGILLKWKRIKLGAIRTIGEYWLRYGYYINRFFQPPQNLKVMENFSYWKMQEVYLTDSADGVTRVPETFKNAIRGIFEKGVTVWSDPNKIGNIDLANNEPVEGFSYE